MLGGGRTTKTLIWRYSFVESDASICLLDTAVGKQIHQRFHVRQVWHPTWSLQHFKHNFTTQNIVPVFINIDEFLKEQMQSQPRRQRIWAMFLEWRQHEHQSRRRIIGSHLEKRKEGRPKET